MNIIKAKDGGWSPYFAGALLGILATASALLTSESLGKTHYLGASTTFVRAAGLLEMLVAEEHVLANEYFTKEKVKLDWQFMLVLAIFLGAFVSAKTDKSFKVEDVPPIWQERFGGSVKRRALCAFFGGVIAMMGARMANGCPSGHGLSGTMQLSASGFVALLMFFAIGSLVAHIVYGRKS